MKKYERAFDHSILEHRKKVDSLKPTIESANSIDRQELEFRIAKDITTQLVMYRPQESSKFYPTLIYIPGTAFVAREIAFTDMICSHLAAVSRSQVIVVNHRLAPENMFPAGIKDACDTFLLLLRNANFFRIDKNKLVIIGYSSGANFAATITKLAIKNRLNVAKQVLISPMMDLSRSLKGYKPFEDQDKTITNNFVNWFLNLYLPENVDLKNPFLSPFWLKKEEIRTLPSTDIIFAEFDRFRSDSEAYYEKLKAAQVDIRKILIPKQDHAFLWHDLNVIQTVGQQVKEALWLSSIPTLPSALEVNYIKVPSEQNTDINLKEHPPESSSEKISERLTIQSCL